MKEKQPLLDSIDQYGDFSYYPNIKVICTFNTDVSKIDRALFRKGRMIAFYEFTPLSLEKTHNLIKQAAQVPDRPMTLAEIFHLNATDYSEVTEQKRIGFISK